jgi:hypothetical protein
MNNDTITPAQYEELWRNHIDLIETVEEIAQANYLFELKPMSAADWGEAPGASAGSFAFRAPRDRATMSEAKQKRL